MDFATLYGSELTRELGSESTTLFTTARRKAAINAAQLEFLERTDCFQRTYALSLTDGVGEYDVEASITDFAWLAKQGVSIWIVSGTTVRYIEGEDLRVTTDQRLNTDRPGWRGTPNGTPSAVYLRPEGGTQLLGFHPKPSIASGDVWVALVHAVVQPAVMTADADVPFTYGANAVTSLAPYHRALVHFAAADLEKFRKDSQRAAEQLQLFEQYVERYQAKQRPKGGQTVRFTRDYRATARRRPTWGSEAGCGSSSGGTSDIATLLITAPASPYDGQLWFELISTSPDTVGLQLYRDGVTTTLYSVVI